MRTVKLRLHRHFPLKRLTQPTQARRPGTVNREWSVRMESNLCQRYCCLFLIKKCLFHPLLSDQFTVESEAGSGVTRNLLCRFSLIRFVYKFSHPPMNNRYDIHLFTLIVSASSFSTSVIESFNQSLVACIRDCGSFQLAFELLGELRSLSSNFLVRPRWRHSGI